MPSFKFPALVVITGPESTGKTTLAAGIAEEEGWIWVKEYAREYLEDLGRPYTMHDLELIARQQDRLIHKALREGKRSGLPVVLADTDLLTIYIWSKVKYGKVSPQIRKALMSTMPDMYLLMYPDVAWEEDPLRESPNDREKLFSIYLRLVKEMNIPFQLIKGEGQARIATAKKAIKSFLK